MKLEDGMLLYHGSYAPIDTIDLTVCASGKDFGQGFYLTESLGQARSFIKNSLRKAKGIGKIPESQKHGYVTTFCYRKCEEDIPVYVFDTADKDWLWFVSMNRRAKLAKEFKTFLTEPLLNAEVIIGKIANDTTNPTIMAYLNGLYGDVASEVAVNFAISRLLPDRLESQYCFLSNRAISCLKRIEVTRYE